MSYATRTDRIRLMLWQLSAVMYDIHKYGVLPLGIRIQVSIPLIQLCLETTELLSCLQAVRGGVALETTGPLGSAGLNAVNKMSSLCPVWLGEFGRGDAGMQMVMSGNFSGVVIEHNFLAQFLGSSEGINYIRAMTTFLSACGYRSVVSGISSSNLFAELKECGVTGFQESCEFQYNRN